MFYPAADVTFLRVMVRPVNYAALLVPFVFTIEFDDIPFG